MKLFKKEKKEKEKKKEESSPKKVLYVSVSTLLLVSFY